MKDVVIVIGGDSEGRFQLRNDFDREQFNVTICNSSAEFITTVKEEKVIAILLFYPGASGTVGELYNNNVISKLIGKVPVVFISSSAAENNRARGLNYKADEFLIEPISFGELLNIINGTVRSSLANGSRQVLAIGDLVLDRVSLTATLRSNKLPLHPIQLRILEFLMLNPGHAFTRQEISRGIWSIDNSIDDRTVDVSIGRIRDALKHKVKVDPIRTIRSVGYAFNEAFGETSSLPKKRHMLKRGL